MSGLARPIATPRRGLATQARRKRKSGETGETISARPSSSGGQSNGSVEEGGGGWWDEITQQHLTLLHSHSRLLKAMLNSASTTARLAQIQPYIERTELMIEQAAAAMPRLGTQEDEWEGVPESPAKRRRAETLEQRPGTSSSSAEGNAAPKRKRSLGGDGELLSPSLSPDEELAEDVNMESASNVSGQHATSRLGVASLLPIRSIKRAKSSHFPSASNTSAPLKSALKSSMKVSTPLRVPSNPATPGNASISSTAQSSRRHSRASLDSAGAYESEFLAEVEARLKAKERGRAKLKDESGKKKRRRRSSTVDAHDVEARGKRARRRSGEAGWEGEVEHGAADEDDAGRGGRKRSKTVG